MKKLLDAMLEVLLELLMMAVFFGLGVLVMWLFGVKIDLLATDPELVMLLGFAIALPLFILASVIVDLVKRRMKKATEEREPSENQTDNRDNTYNNP